MFQPLLENTAKTIQYILVWVIYAVLHSIVLYSLVDFPLEIIVLNGVVHAVVFGLLGMALRIIFKYGNYMTLNRFQRLTNYAALGILIIGAWLTSGYGFFYWFVGAEFSVQLLHIMPSFGFTGLAIYLLMIQLFTQGREQNEEAEETSNPGMQLNSELLPEASLPKKMTEAELLERIAVKSGTKIHVVAVPEIMYLQADGDYVQIFTAGGKYLKEQTMKYFEEHLPANQFVRVHRSIIVNVEMISRIELYEKQNQLLTLRGGQQIKTSPAGYKALRATLSL